MSDPDVESPAGDGFEDLARAPLQVFPAGDVVEQRGPGEVERAAGMEALRVHRRYRAAGRAVEDEHAAHSQAVHAGVERGLADAVVGDRDTLPTGQCAHLGREI